MASQSLAVIANICFARILGKNGFGTLSVIVLTTTLFVTFAASAMTMSAAKFIAERRVDKNRVGSVISLGRMVSLSFGALAALAIALSADIIDRRFLHQPATTGLLRWSGFLVLLNSVSAHQTGVLAGFEDFRTTAISNTIRNTILLVSGALLSWGYGIGGALSAYFLGNAAAVVYSGMAIRRRMLPIPLLPAREDWRLLLGFGGPVLLASLSFTPIVWWANASLARRWGVGEVGIFQVANQWQLIIMFFANALSGLGLPILSNLAAGGEFGDYWRSFRI